MPLHLGRNLCYVLMLSLVCLKLRSKVLQNRGKTPTRSGETSRWHPRIHFFQASFIPESRRRHTHPEPVLRSENRELKVVKWHHPDRAFGRHPQLKYALVCTVDAVVPLLNEFFQIVVGRWVVLATAKDWSVGTRPRAQLHCLRRRGHVNRWEFNS